MMMPRWSGAIPPARVTGRTMGASIKIPAPMSTRHPVPSPNTLTRMRNVYSLSTVSVIEVAQVVRSPVLRDFVV
jgi:hypothetical protein